MFAMSSAGVWILAQDWENSENVECLLPVSSNEQRGLKLPRKYIASPVNSTGDANSSLHNIPVNRNLSKIYIKKIYHS